MGILIRNNPDKKWRPAKLVNLKAEADLETLLTDSPELINISDIREDMHARMLVFAIKQFYLSGSGYSDIIGFTPEGDIALIECKLDKNQEIKREVIGQILEYASYLWKMSYDEFDEQIQQKKGKSLADLMKEHVPDPQNWDEKNFTQGIKKTLETGAFILIVVVDKINDQLRKIIRYVNDCSESTYFSLHALEMSQFHVDKTNTDILVPHLYGVSTKSLPGNQRVPRTWTEDTFFEEADKYLIDKKTQKTLRQLFEFCKSGIGKVEFGKGRVNGTFRLSLKYGDSWVKLCTLSYNPQFTWFSFRKMVEQGIDRETISNFMEKLKTLGFELDEKNVESEPTFDVSLLNDENQFEKFKKYCIALKNELLSN